MRGGGLGAGQAQAVAEVSCVTMRTWCGEWRIRTGEDGEALGAHALSAEVRIHVPAASADDDTNPTHGSAVAIHGSSCHKTSPWRIFSLATNPLPLPPPNILTLTFGAICATSMVGSRPVSATSTVSPDAA